MERKLVLFSFTVILLVSCFGAAYRVGNVQASSTIYIRADGSIDGTTDISTVDNVTYTFTDNINDSIVVERSNIIIDGAGYTLQGTGSGGGFDCSGINNVTIQNTNIKNFYRGIVIDSSSNNSVSGNNITANNYYGIWLYNSSNYNSIQGNNITNNDYGIYLHSSSNSIISGNTFTNDGLYVYDSYQNSVENNTVNGRSLVYLEGVSNYTVDDAGQVILVRCENIRVEGLNLSRTSVGVELWETGNSTISGNNIANNYYGIRLNYYSNYNSISGNNIADNGHGIRLYYSSNNSIQGNNITANNYEGIYLHSSSNNSVSGNNITNNGYGIVIDSSSNNSVSGNNITNNGYGIYLTASSNYNSIQGNTITANNYYGIGLNYYSNYNSISGNNMASHMFGIGFSYSSNNSVSGNNITNNGYGIWLYSSSNNSVSGNNITNNGYGIWLDYSSDNIVYHNNFINNQQVLVTVSANNTWDNGCEGNYWSNYFGTDSDGDGIGNTPYIIDGSNQDNYPLMNCYWNPADINHDLKVDIFDVVSACSAYQSTPVDMNWNCHCDIAEPAGIINIFDIVMICSSYGEEY